jgi:uncharacterized membrane protein
MKNKILNVSFLLLLSIYAVSFLFLLAGLVLTNVYFGALSFILFLFLPGILILSIFGIRKITIQTILISIGLSLAELILIGLITNFVFYQSALPLYSYHIFSITLFFGFIKSIFVLIQRASIKIELPTFFKFDVVLLPFPIFSNIFAIGGAIRINNGASNDFSLIALGIVAVTIFLLIMFSKRISETSIVISLFLIGLSLLFMTSLRSVGISGHDIRSEYNVYLKTMFDLRWSMNNLRDAYNACMSITILPTVATSMFLISGLTFFKVIAQVIFALVPIVIYCFSKSHLDKKMSIVSSLLFITFPTFLIDSPMIVRQEIGFLFFSLLILIIYGEIKDIRFKLRKILFLIFSFALILSHYSSAYIFIGLLILVLVIKIILNLIKRKISNSEDIITPVTCLIVVVFAILWYSQITAVSTSFTGTLLNSIKDIPDIYSQDNRDGSVNYIFFKPAVDQGKQIIEYEQSTAVSNNIVPNLLFISQTSDTYLANIFSDIYYSIGPKIYELLVGLGLIIILFVKRIRLKHNISMEFVVFAFIGMFLIFLQVILPNLTLSYGLMRAFQQMLIFLVVPISIILSVSLKHFKSIITSLLIISLLLVYSGFINEFIQGVPAEFSLHNSGPYYDSYYYHPQDIASLSWLIKPNPNTDNYEYIHSNITGSLYTVYPTRYNFSTNMLPFQVPISDEVVMGSSVLKNGFIYISVSGKLLPVKLSAEDYGERNVVYSNGASLILSNIIQK